MAWKTRGFVAGQLGDVVTIQGDRPSVKINISSLINSLEKALMKGASTVELDGLGTLHIEGSVLLSTESQI